MSSHLLAFRQPSRILVACALLLMGLAFPAQSLRAQQEPATFVMQLTRSADNYGHRRALMQIDRVLSDIGEDKLKITVVAYENGIQALLADNEETSQLLLKLAARGVTFKACRISMGAWGLSEEQFPLEVAFVPAGAPEVIRLQMLGYRYWRP